MRIIRITIAIIGILFCFQLLPLTIHAQSAGDSIAIDVLPPLPAPGETTTIVLSSFAVNLDGAKITWNINGAVKLSAFGAKKYSFSAGKVGVSTRVTITILLPTGESVQKVVTVKPAEADLLWESADAYVPPFYKGRALPASESLIKIVAIPNIKNQNASLIYNWKKNYQVMQSDSGYGKNSFLFKASYLNKNEKVQVTISSPDGSYAATKELTITPYSPQIIFYKKNPLEGIAYNRALVGTFVMNEPETTLVAEPYYFSPKNKESSQLSYVWKLNGNTITIDKKKSELIVRKGTATEGIAKIDLAIESIPKLFQLSKTTLMINLSSR
jgi:hypothetical protein